MTKSLSLKAATQFLFNFTEEFVFPNAEIQVKYDMSLHHQDAQHNLVPSS